MKLRKKNCIHLPAPGSHCLPSDNFACLLVRMCRIFWPTFPTSLYTFTVDLIINSLLASVAPRTMHLNRQWRTTISNWGIYYLRNAMVKTRTQHVHISDQLIAGLSIQEIREPSNQAKQNNAFNGPMSVRLLQHVGWCECDWIFSGADCTPLATLSFDSQKIRGRVGNCEKQVSFP